MFIFIVFEFTPTNPPTNPCVDSEEYLFSNFTLSTVQLSIVAVGYIVPNKPPTLSVEVVIIEFLTLLFLIGFLISLVISPINPATEPYLTFFVGLLLFIVNLLTLQFSNLLILQTIPYNPPTDLECEVISKPSTLTFSVFTFITKPEIPPALFIVSDDVFS